MVKVFVTYVISMASMLRLNVRVHKKSSLLWYCGTCGCRQNCCWRGTVGTSVLAITEGNLGTAPPR